MTGVTGSLQSESTDTMRIAYRLSPSMLLIGSLGDRFKGGPSLVGSDRWTKELVADD
jgi:hypothetical protein